MFESLPLFASSAGERHHRGPDAKTNSGAVFCGAVLRRRRVPSPGQLQNRVQSVGNFSSLSRQPPKATAYVSPTIKGSASMLTSTSLQSLNSSSGSNGGVGSGIPLLSKPPSGGGTPASAPSIPRSSLPRPASFVGTTSSTPRNKVAQPVRSLLTPPKSLSTLSALRDSTWRDGCY
ncbi:SLAIN motif-containing protein 1 [Lates calcarifer]|uniref:SLAIN motif-containing protein 1 n=1 Tax=Lates calcarifer TaxID=8187 RepID=A0AAJ8DK45_LATCA|nr:SLAIN motif-containing protein 1 [Lates calcarifer]XP_050922045.1 SLAIN motif-containing protein 1 [Lates calcarifer]XP_050922046.1 SLAIN motif-containing protein 1 [Lates calcarifer]XP_050922047.1 SLAIN motif-containing protein 1 [Lates calcarifer]